MELLQKEKTFFPKKIFRYSLWMVIIAVSFVFGSCHRGQMKFSFLKLDSATVFKYYNAPKFRKLVFQFVIPDLNSNRKNVQLVGFALDSNYDQIEEPFILAYATDSASKVFEGPGIYGNLELTKKDLESLIESGGNFISYNYLLLAPEKDMSTNQIFYNVDLRPETAGNKKQSSSLNPSPPAKPGLNLE
jgi:hypothetical protein